MPDVIAGRFSLVDLIATGGSGAVWRAHDLRKGELCAAKVLRQRDSGDLLRFVREKGVQFDHPHLVTPYSWAAEDEHVVIASRLVSGGTLSSLVKQRGPLAAVVVAELLDQLLDALDHMHQLGWVHRDVKTANILMEATGDDWPHLGLSDFGIAVHPGDARLTQLGAVIGTDGYLGPEVMAGAAPAPSRDLYAAGVVALRVLGLTREELPPPSHDALAAVLHALTDPDPERRPSAAQARNRLAHHRTGSPTTAAGAPLQVNDRMPPLGEGVVPVGGTVVSPVLAPGSTGPRTTGSRPVSTPSAQPWGAGADTASQSWTPTAPGGGQGWTAVAPPRTSSWSVGRLVGAGVALVGVVLLIALRPQDAPAPAAEATTLPGLVVEAGDACSWTLQGETAGTGDDGAVATCLAGDDDYTWTVPGS